MTLNFIMSHYPELSRFDYHHEIIDLMYYSFVTLATVGYGDITPASAPARALAMIEAGAGQFYVAILIARLVSIRYSRWGSAEETGPWSTSQPVCYRRP
jgi:hypothetical protein